MSDSMSLTKSLVVLAMIGLIDSISYMAVSPSLIFYVLQAGGDKEMYGLVMSAFSFASFCGKPVYGIWVDKGGNKFRRPYFASFVIAILGALLYFFASACASPRAALAMILVGRLCSGLGGANQALGYAYIASVVPPDQQTRTNTILSMMRILGMAAGPGVNLFLQDVHAILSIGGFSFAIDPLNSVGLLLAAGNLVTLGVTFWALEEPPEKPEKKLPAAAAEQNTLVRRSSGFFEDVWSIDILLPIGILLVVNSSFQLVETAFPPAAADGLGWGPVETSAVLGSTSIVLFFTMILTVFLSGKISDTVMVAIGHCAWIVGGSGMYLFWKRGASVIRYVLPIVVAIAGFPFISASNRSNYTKAVASRPSLEESQALMQSVLSMSASVAGFVTPGLVAAYVLRSPEEVTASRDQRELTPFALYVPVLPLFVLAGLWRVYQNERASSSSAATATKAVSGSEDDGDLEASETTGLLSPQTPQKTKKRETRRSSVVACRQALSGTTEVYRRTSGLMMAGITCPDTQDEIDISAKNRADMEAWMQLAEMMDSDDEL